MIAPDSLKLPLLEHPQERDLSFHREITDFIQEERATVSGLKPTHPPLECTGECSLFMAEELGSDQRFWNGRTVHADEGSVGAFRSPMQRVGNQLFTGSGFAQNKDGRI